MLSYSLIISTWKCNKISNIKIAKHSWGVHLPSTYSPTCSSQNLSHFSKPFTLHPFQSLESHVWFLSSSPHSPHPISKLFKTDSEYHHRLTTALSNSMNLWAMPCRATQDRQVMVESSDKTWSTGEGNGKPLKYSSIENPMNNMKRQKERTLKDELPR